jgi:hypothetical protein
MTEFKIDNKRVLTRREVIEEWNKSSEYLDSFCCPNCRDILFKDNDTGELECRNILCKYGEEVFRYIAEDFEPYIESSEEEVSEEKVIVAQWVQDHLGLSLRIIRSDLDHFAFEVGSMMDFGYIHTASQKGYTVIIKPMEDKGK